MSQISWRTTGAHLQTEDTRGRTRHGEEFLHYLLKARPGRAGRLAALVICARCRAPASGVRSGGARRPGAMRPRGSHRYRSGRFRLSTCGTRRAADRPWPRSPARTDWPPSRPAGLAPSQNRAAFPALRRVKPREVTVEVPGRGFPIPALLIVCAAQNPSRAPGGGPSGSPWPNLGGSVPVAYQGMGKDWLPVRPRGHDGQQLPGSPRIYSGVPASACRAAYRPGRNRNP